VKNYFPFILILGGGDLASGVALRLKRVGINILISETAQPLAVRRMVSFAEAVYRGKFSVEGVTAQSVQHIRDIKAVMLQGDIPVIVDPNCDVIRSQPQLSPVALIDARMTKRTPDIRMDSAPLVIGLGPGFNAGQNCHAAIETNRGHFLGRVLWKGKPETDTGIPGTVAKHQHDRVLRAPVDGQFHSDVDIGHLVRKGQLVAVVEDQPIFAPFEGILRGLLHDGLHVSRGLKVGDIDPRGDSRFASLVSEKSLAIGGGVLEALLTHSEIRRQIWN
jgi:xanthine dehydrogenase accessory factor